ncbi:hypothetical protein M422DRAFT_36806, partial [Sphaerobolus stellatus SS14]
MATNYRCVASSFGSVLSFEELGIDVEKVIADPRIQTSVLVNEAHTIAKNTLDVVLHSYKNHTVYVGVLLEALIDYAGKDAIPGRGDITGERYTAGAIYAAYKVEKVSEVAQAWFQSMIVPMKIACTRTVKPFEARTPLEESEYMRAMVEPATRNGKAWLRKEVCQRQNFRCILHEEIDTKAPPEARDPTGERTIEYRLEVAHIIPFALNDFASDDNRAIHKSAVIWVMIKHWTAVDLTGEGINEPTNAILFCPNGHDQFGSFSVFFEPTEVQHCYVASSQYKGFDNIHVDFRSNSRVLPPNPRYLAIHAAFAKVLFASGAGKYIGRYYRDQAEIGVLASNGSTDVSILLSRLYMIEM